jgi:hypothetical protein
MADGAVHPYCSMVTKPLPESTTDGQRIRELSRERVGRDQDEIEAELTRITTGDGTTRAGSEPLGRKRRPER